jgi:hypothetical protein
LVEAYEDASHGGCASGRKASLGRRIYLGSLFGWMVRQVVHLAFLWLLWRAGRRVVELRLITGYCTDSDVIY